MGSYRLTRGPKGRICGVELMKQERVMRAKQATTVSPPAAEEVTVEEADASLLTDIDELLDEIDAVLEDQAILFEYRQRSGQ